MTRRPLETTQSEPLSSGQEATSRTVGGERHTPVVRGVCGSASRSLVGTAGEAAAVAHYRRVGYRVLARNWRCRLGEIDLVLFRGRTLIVCEVKSRRGSALGGPFEAVTRAKQRKLRLLAETFLIASGLRPPEVRFDVASVMIDAGGTARVHVFENAF